MKLAPAALPLIALPPEVLRKMRASGQPDRFGGIAHDPSRWPCASAPAGCEADVPR